MYRGLDSYRGYAIIEPNGPDDYVEIWFAGELVTEATNTDQAIATINEWGSSL